MKNGFTKEQHYAVASDIENLFKVSLKVLEHADKNGSPDIEAIHRFVAPIHIRDGVAYITVKQIKGDGNRLYSMECIEIRKLAGMSAQSDSELSEPRPSSTSFRKDNMGRLVGMLEDVRRSNPRADFPIANPLNDNIAKLMGRSQKKDKKFSDPPAVNIIIPKKPLGPTLERADT